MNNIITTLKEIATYPSKTIGSRLRNKPELMAYITEFSTIHGTRKINEAMYCIANDTIPSRCACGKIARFETFDTGYAIFCSFKCPEKGKAHSSVMSKVWEDEGKVSGMLETRDATMLDRYGVKSAMKHKPFRDKFKSTIAAKKAAVLSEKHGEIYDNT